MKGIRELRRLALRVVDAAFLVKSPAALQGAAVILHGASCSGKSSVLRRLKKRYSGCTYLETDRLQYWKFEANPGLLNIALDLLTDAGVPVEKSRALLQSIEQAHREPEKSSRHGSLVELLKTCLKSDAIIATCGNLPPPNIDNDFYQLLGQCTNKTTLHVLVAPDSAVHAERIRARGRDANLKRFIASSNQRLRNGAHYDLVLNGSETTAVILDLLRVAITRKRSSAGADGCLIQATSS